MNNIYLLVEGRKTEAQLYPLWIQWLLEGFSRVDVASDAVQNQFYLISGGGYPSLLDVTLVDAIEELNSLPQYKHFFICLDSDEFSADERRKEVEEALEAHELEHADVHIIVQHRCIETWLLGNQSLCPNQPANDADCIRYLRHYRVDQADPEQMPIIEGERIHAQFHEKYLKAIFRERNMGTYRKFNPGHAAQAHYFQALLNRLQNTPGHIPSFETFVETCKTIPILPTQGAA